MTEVHVVVPAGIDDPAQPSGGNVYDRRLCDGLLGRGWTVHEHTTLSAEIPDDAVVLVDGLIAAPAPRLSRLVVLVHMPIGDYREGEVLRTAAAVITTSEWSRRRLLEAHGLPAERVHVAIPGVEPADMAQASATGERLLCVAAVTPEKGHDLLLSALATLTDLGWCCTCVGSLDRDPAFVRQLPEMERVHFTGPRCAPDYAAADLLVVPSRTEAYGMVITEALAHGIPVIACDVGGVSEALGGGGLLVAGHDLGPALREWLTDASLRERLRRAARARRNELPTWAATVDAVASMLR